MAAEINHRHSATGETLYATIRKPSGTYWNTAGTPNFETLTVANWGDYDVALSESPASSYFYVGTFPAVSGNMVAGWYWVDVFKRAGGSPAIGDVLQASYFGYWDGTTYKWWGEDTVAVGGTVQTARDLGASVLLSAGTGTGQLDFTSGVVKSNLVQILATALTETAGYLAAGFKKFFNVASPTSTMNQITLVDTTTANTDMRGTDGANTTTPPTAAAVADAVWDEASTGHTDAGKAGAQMWTDIDAIAVDVAGLDGAAMRGTDSAALASVCTETRLAELDAANLPAVLDTVATDVAGLDGDAMRGTDGAYTGTPPTPPTAAAIADAVWDEVATGHTDAGKAGAQVWTDIDAIVVDVAGLDGAAMRGTDGANTTTPPTAASIADAVWDEASTGHTDAGKAGAQMWTDIDALIAGVGITGIDATTANKLADHILRRSYALARASANGDTLVFRSLLGGIAKLVNAVEVDGTDLLVMHEDDATTFGTQAITSDAAAEPIVGLNTT